VYRATFRDKHDHTVIVMHPTRQVIEDLCNWLEWLLHS
jgi:hypothetical protein